MKSCAAACTDCVCGVLWHSSFGSGERSTGKLGAGRLSSPLSEDHLTGDVSFGYGLLATTHSGSSFIIIRNSVALGVWKTTVPGISLGQILPAERRRISRNGHNSFRQSSS